MTSEEAIGSLGEFKERSMEIMGPGFVEGRWAALCAELEAPYMTRLLAQNRWARAILRRSGFHRWFWSAQERCILLNLIRCATHREVFETALGRERAT